MEEETIEFELHNFTGHQCLNGSARKAERKNDPKSDRRWSSDIYSLNIYPNGNKPENADYVSVVFGMCDFDVKDHIKKFRGCKDDLFLCVLYIVDANGNLRFLQSFGMNLEEGWFLRTVLPVEIDRFVRRRVLLDASEELVPGDTLTLRCDLSVVYSDHYNETQSYMEFAWHLKVAALEESWYITLEDGSRALDLRNADSPLCTRLRKRSDFFRVLFRSPCKEMEDGYMTVEKINLHGNSNSFDAMLGYIRFGSTLHLCNYFHFKKVYELACVYGVRDLEEICIGHFEQNLTKENAIEILRIADSRGDAELRTLAFQKALANWKTVRLLPPWRNLRLEWPRLANELSCAARILNFEKRPELFGLVAGQVLRNRWKWRHSHAWSIFAKKQPDLAKAILEPIRTSSTVYKGHVSDYDFYR